MFFPAIVIPTKRSTERGVRGGILDVAGKVSGRDKDPRVTPKEDIAAHGRLSKGVMGPQVLRYGKSQTRKAGVYVQG